METPIQDTNKKQGCNISIMFVVDTDEEAIAYKKQVADIFSSMNDVQINFRLMNAPNNGRGM